MCHLYSDGSQMLQRDQSQRENKKLSERSRSPDASPTPGSKRQRKRSQLCSDTLLLQHFLWVPILSTYCMQPSCALGGAQEGQGEESLPVRCKLLILLQRGHFEDW